LSFSPVEVDIWGLQINVQHSLAASLGVRYTTGMKPILEGFIRIGVTGLNLSGHARHQRLLTVPLVAFVAALILRFVALTPAVFAQATPFKIVVNRAPAIRTVLHSNLLRLANFLAYFVAMACGVRSCHDATKR
jgi:hypothetical protein